MWQASEGEGEGGKNVQGREKTSAFALSFLFRAHSFHPFSISLGRLPRRRVKLGHAFNSVNLNFEKKGGGGEEPAIKVQDKRSCRHAV